MDAKLLFAAIRTVKGTALNQGDVDLVNAAMAGSPLVPSRPAEDCLTVRGAGELIGHEAIVLEWYKDSEGIGTWGIGVTNKSGHNVDQYKDKPQTLEHVLEVYIWLLRKSYLPEVLKAFAGRALSEAQLSAALSFHYNTGAVLRTDWVQLWLAGKTADARKHFTSHYLNGGDLQERRNKEAALFFDGKWAGDGKATILGVNKPSYTPSWKSAKRVPIVAALTEAMAS